MADVRLTATNPEDSSVVPVACDAAGRLLLEEPQVIEGPPGPPGEQGPPGQNGQDGDPFSGNFAGDVTFGGSATFAGAIVSGKTPDSSSNTINGSSLNMGTIFTQVPAGFGDTNEVYGQYYGTESAVSFKADGSAEFAGNVSVGPHTTIYSSGTYEVKNDSFAVSLNAIDIQNASGTVFKVLGNGTTGIGGDPTTGTDKINLGANGSAEFDGSVAFAGNKAGFTAEGYLWCTTRRGDTVILDATSNGLASWVEYTPTTRLEEIRDKLDANRGDTGEMPADTP